MFSKLQANQPGYFRIMGTVEGRPTAVYIPPTNDKGDFLSGDALANDLELRKKKARDKAKRGDLSPVVLKGEPKVYG
jgi:hypothetical protein